MSNTKLGANNPPPPMTSTPSTRKWTSLTSTREPRLAAFDVAVVDRLPPTTIRLDGEMWMKKVIDDEDDEDEAPRRVFSILHLRV